jgi:hypothetical protein
MNKNHFKFTISYNKQPFIERYFDADCYNHIVRYSIKIQDWNKQIISDLREVMSKNTKELSNINEYDLSKTVKDYVKFKNNQMITNLASLERKQPQHGFSYTLYINNNTIIERDFSIYDFNVASLFSSDLINVVTEWIFRIQSRIKKNDEQQMWDDYDLINEYNLTSKEVRELSEDERKRKLYSIYRKHEALVKSINEEVILTDAE